MNDQIQVIIYMLCCLLLYADDSKQQWQQLLPFIKLFSGDLARENNAKKNK